MSDSLCTDSAIVNIIFIPSPLMFCSDTSVCEDSPPFTLKGCTPSGGVCIPSVFDPSANAPGTYFPTYVYTYSQNPTCVVSVQFPVTVIAKPQIDHDSINPFVCVTDPPITFNFRPSGGIIKIDGGHQGQFTVIPSVIGLGGHMVEYSYTDPVYHCTNSDTLFFYVIDTFSVRIISHKTFSTCSNSFELEAIVSDAGNYSYLWLPTNERTSKITVSAAGSYSVIVSNPTDCTASDTIEISILDYCSEPTTIEINNDTNYQPITGHYVNFTDTWINETVISDCDIVIPFNVTLTINKSLIYMRNCSKIIVLNGGHLIIDSSSIGGCDWKGIEVWGWWDACSDDYYWQGKLVINHSSVCHADIGIFAGNRPVNGRRHNREFSGGVIDVRNCTFSNNYVDIMFSDWNVGGICLQYPWDSCRFWRSKIISNYFDQLSDNRFCDDYVNDIIRDYDNFYRIQGLTPYVYIDAIDVPSRCHIIDLSPYHEIGQYEQPSIYTWNWCSRAAWDAGPLHLLLDILSYCSAQFK